MQPSRYAVDSTSAIVVPCDDGASMGAPKRSQGVAAHVFVRMGAVNEKQVYALVIGDKVECGTVTVEPVDSVAKATEAACAHHFLIHDGGGKARRFIGSQIERIHFSLESIGRKMCRPRSFVSSNFKDDFRFDDLRDGAEANQVRAVRR